MTADQRIRFRDLAATRLAAGPGVWVVAAVAGAWSGGTANAVGFMLVSALYLPWLVVGYALRQRRRRSPHLSDELHATLRTAATPALISSSGIFLTALVIVELLAGRARVVGTVFVSPGSVVSIALGCLTVTWCAAAIDVLRRSGRRRTADIAALGGVATLFIATTLGTVVVDALVGSAFGFAIGAVMVASCTYVFGFPWTPEQFADRTRVLHRRLVGSRRRPRRDVAVTMDAGARRAASTRAYLGVCVFVLLAVVVPAFIVAAGGPSRSGRLWMLIVPILALAAWRLAWLVRRGERRLLEMTFWVFTYTFMGLAPLAQIRDHSAPETVPRPSWDYVPQAAAVVLVGSAAFIVGTWIASRRSPAAPADEKTAPAGTDEIPVELRSTVSYRKLVVLSVFTIALNAYYLLHVGLIQFTRSRIDALLAYVDVWATGSIGILILPATYMSLLVTWIAWMRFRREMQTQQSAGRVFPASAARVSLFFTILIGILLANTMNPISNARYLSGTAMLAAAVAFGLFSTPNRFRVMTVTFVLAFVVIFPLADAFRFTDTAEVKTSGPMQSLLSADYDSFVQVENGLLVAARHGIEPGRQFLGVLLWWFPRSAWPNKPLDTGIFIAQNRGYPFTNLSAPLWVEFFMNGGWLLLVVGFVALGFAFYRWDCAIDAQMHHSRMPTVLGSILPFYLLILLRGSLLQAMSYLTFILIFAFCVKAAKGRPDGPFSRRWLPESVRYTDVAVPSERDWRSTVPDKVGAHVG